MTLIKSAITGLSLAMPFICNDSEACDGCILYDEIVGMIKDRWDICVCGGLDLLYRYAFINSSYLPILKYSRYPPIYA